MENSHRMFLQCVMSKGVLVGKDVRKFYRSCREKFNEDTSDEGLVEFVSTINLAVKPMALEIKKAIAEGTGVHYYCLINSNDAGFMKLAADYSVNDMEFFKKLLELAVECDSGTVPAPEALNLVGEVEKLTKKDAQELLNKLERAHWISKNSEGCYALSARCLLELEPFLLEKYPDTTTRCNMCKRICIQGQTCSDCPVKIHLHCATTFFSKQVNKTCPTCGKPWTHEVPGPKASPVKDASISQATESRKRRADKR